MIRTIYENKIIFTDDTLEGLLVKNNFHRRVKSICLIRKRPHDSTHSPMCPPRPLLPSPRSPAPSPHPLLLPHLHSHFPSASTFSFSPIVNSTVIPLRRYPQVHQIMIQELQAKGKKADVVAMKETNLTTVVLGSSKRKVATTVPRANEGSYVEEADPVGQRLTSSSKSMTATVRGHPLLVTVEQGTPDYVTAVEGAVLQLQIQDWMVARVLAYMTVAMMSQGREQVWQGAHGENRGDDGWSFFCDFQLVLCPKKVFRGGPPSLPSEKIIFQRWVWNSLQTLSIYPPMKTHLDHCIPNFVVVAL